MQSLLIPEKSKPIICVFIRSSPIMDIPLTLTKCPEVRTISAIYSPSVVRLPLMGRK